MSRRDFIAAAGLGIAAAGVAGAAEPTTSTGDLPEAQLLSDGDVKTYLLIFRSGQEVMKGLVAFARKHKLEAGTLNGIGAISDAVLGYFDPEKKKYVQLRQSAQFEILSLTGNLALKDVEPFFHVHTALGRIDGPAWGGHLFEATVRPTVEIVLTSYSKPMRRKIDAEWRIPLLNPRAGDGKSSSQFQSKNP
jgi:predicted DNA-binding protein with PD1-like motif